MITQRRRIDSPDQGALPDKLRGQQFPASGYAELEDTNKLPLDGVEGREAYERYLQAPLPRAFAVAPGRQQWAWKAAAAGDVNAQALERCQERARQACVLYSVDDNVVYK